MMNVGILAKECPYFYIRAFLMPVFVKEMDDDEASLVMVDSDYVSWVHDVKQRYVSA